MPLRPVANQAPPPQRSPRFRRLPGVSPRRSACLAVCLASHPAARFRRSPGGSPPPPQRPPLPPRPVGLRRGAGARGRGMRGGELEACSKAAAAVSGHFPYGLRKRESRLAPNAKAFSVFSQVSGIGPLPRGRSAA